MSISQTAPIIVSLTPGAPELPSTAETAIAIELSSTTLENFLGLSGSLSTLPVNGAGIVQTLEDIGLDPSDVGYIDATGHFSQDRKPDVAYLTHRGRADKTHIQTISLTPDTGSTTQARTGVYRLDEIEGGPYLYNSLGALQVTDLTIVDAGGGFGANGKYQITDLAGNLFTHEAGGTNLWTFVVLSAAAGLYTVTAEGVLYQYLASGTDTVTQIRDGLLADMNNLISHPGGHPEWISNTSGVDSITLTASAIGFQLTVTSNDGPGGTEASITETTPLVPETVGAIATSLDTLILAAPPLEWTTSVAAAVITATAQAAFIGVDLQIVITGPASGDATTTVTTDHRETVATVMTALDVAITAQNHPTFLNSILASVITLTGVTAGVAIPVTLSSPGSSLVLAETQSTITLRVAQTSRVTVIAQTGTDAYVGLYQLKLFATTLDHTSLIGDSITDVRDALRAKVDANLSSLTTTSDVGTDAFNITAINAGKAFTLTFTSPGSNAGGTTSLVTASYGAADDLDRAIVDEDKWYFWFMRGTQIDKEAITDHLDNIAASFPRRAFFESDNNAIPNVPQAVASDIGWYIKISNTRRSTVLWNPNPSSLVDDVEGVTTRMLGEWGTFPPGKIQPHNMILDNVSGGQKLTVAQETNLRAKSAGFFEKQRQFPASASVVTNIPYAADGTLLDTQRALDQIARNYQVGVAFLFAAADIVPHTEGPAGGIGMIDAKIAEITTGFVNQQLVIAGSFIYLPDGSLPALDGPGSNADLGIFPDFVFSIKIQLGGVQVAQEIQVTF